MSCVTRFRPRGISRLLPARWGFREGNCGNNDALPMAGNSGVVLGLLVTGMMDGFEGYQGKRDGSVVIR